MTPNESTVEDLDLRVRRLIGSILRQEDRFRSSAHRYDAFISYNREADQKLAPALQGGLQRFAAPWYRTRTLRIFRDETNLSANPALWNSVQEALDASRFFILLASPSAARSRWVAREIQYWRESKTDPARTILIAQTDGPAAEWDDMCQDFLFVSEAAIPPTLAGLFTDAPHWVDLRFAHGRDRRSLRGNREFRTAVAQLAAPILGKDIEDVESDEVRQHRRNILWAWSAIIVSVGLAAVAIALGLQFLSERNAAQASTRLAVARALSVNAKAESRLDLALLLSVEACRLSCDAESESALVDGLGRTWNLIAYVHTPSNTATCVAVSPDGKTFAAGTDQGTVALWNSPHAPPRVLRVPSRAGVRSIAFSPDGKWLAAGNRDGTIVLFNLATASLIQLPSAGSGDSGSAGAVAYNPTGTRLAYGWGLAVVIWDVSQPAKPRRLTTLRTGKYVSSVTFDPSGNALLVGTDYGIQLWNFLNQSRRSLGSPQIVNDISFGSNGRTVLAGTSVGTIDVRNTYDGSERRLLVGTVPVTSLAVSPDERTAAAGTTNGSVELWTIENGEGPVLLPIQSPSITGVAFTPEGNKLLASGNDGAVALWDIQWPGRRARVLDGTTSVTGKLAFSQDGKQIAGVSWDAGAQQYGLDLWSAAEGKRTKVFLAGHAASKPLGLNSLAFAPNGRWIVAGTSDGLELWNLQTGARQRTPIGGDQKTVAFDPNGKSIASIAGNGATTLWRVSGSNVTESSSSADEHATTLAFSPDGKLLAEGTEEGEIILWSSSFTGRRVIQARSSSPLLAVDFSPDGRSLATLDLAGAITVWNGKGFSRSQILPSSDSSTTDIAFAPDANTLLSVDFNGQLTFWNIREAHAAGTLPPLAVTSSIAVSRNGQVATSGSTALLWDGLTPVGSVEPLFRRFCQIAGRNLTHSEWNEFLPGQTYHRTCS